MGGGVIAIVVAGRAAIVVAVVAGRAGIVDVGSGAVGRAADAVLEAAMRVVLAGGKGFLVLAVTMEVGRALDVLAGPSTSVCWQRMRDMAVRTNRRWCSQRILLGDRL